VSPEELNFLKDSWILGICEFFTFCIGK